MLALSHHSFAFIFLSGRSILHASVLESALPYSVIGRELPYLVHCPPVHQRPIFCCFPGGNLGSIWQFFQRRNPGRCWFGSFRPGFLGKNRRWFIYYYLLNQTKQDLLHQLIWSDHFRPAAPDWVALLSIFLHINLKPQALSLSI